MLKSYNFCNNCGGNGHVFHQCKKPITSIGIIAYKHQEGTNEILYLLIRRKDTLGFVDFMRGKYNLHDKKYIQNIVNVMTNDEKRRILKLDFDMLWRQLWGENVGIQYRGEEKTSREKFHKLKTGIMYKDELYTLESIINESSNIWKEPEWGFPKGRRNYQEKDIPCAIREFSEETGYTSSSIQIIQNVLPFEEVFTGSNLKSYKHCYYLANLYHEPLDCPIFQETEVSDMKWVTYKDALTHFRNYNIEKCDILTRVHTMLRDYRICR